MIAQASMSPSWEHHEQNDEIESTRSRQGVSDGDGDGEAKVLMAVQ